MTETFFAAIEGNQNQQQWQAGDRPLVINWNGGVQQEFSFVWPPEIITCDGDNRVTSILGNSANPQFIYDGNGNRVKKTENSETIKMRLLRL